MKKMTTGLLLWALAFSLPAQEPLKPAADDFKRIERWKFELPDSIKMEEMQARLKELQTRLLSENRLHEEQAKLARKYAEQAVAMQKSLAESPQWRSDLAKMQFEMQKGLALAGLYKDRMMDLFDEAQVEQHKQIMALESKCLDLSSLYKESRDAEKQKKIEQELEEAVTQLFDLREGQLATPANRTTAPATSTDGSSRRRCKPADASPALSADRECTRPRRRAGCLSDGRRRCADAVGRRWQPGRPLALAPVRSSDHANAPAPAHLGRCRGHEVPS